MAYAVELVVEGVDFDDWCVLDLLGSRLGDLAWSRVDGLLTATLEVPDGTDPVCAASDVAHRIENSVPGAAVIRVHEDLVSATQVAERLGVSRETVRLWALGRNRPNFPAPRGSVAGQGAAPIRVWAWRDVAEWAAAHYELRDDTQPLTLRQVAEIDAHLQRVDHGLPDGWQPAASHYQGQRPNLIAYLASPGEPHVLSYSFKTVTTLAHWQMKFHDPGGEPSTTERQKLPVADPAKDFISAKALP